MTSRMHGIALLGSLALTGALLTGCTATAAPEPEPTSTVASDTTPAPTPTIEPSAEPTPAAATCDTVLTPDAMATLASDGLVEHEAGQTHYPFADELIAAGALACKWGKPSSDIVLLVVQLDDVDPAAWSEPLAAAGYVQTDDPVEGTYTGPVDGGTGAPSIVIVDGDRLTFLTSTFFIDDLAAAS